MTDGRTHWDECWRQHHDCAVAEVERLRAMVAMGAEYIQSAINSGDWKVDGACDPDDWLQSALAFQRAAEPTLEPLLDGLSTQKERTSKAGAADPDRLAVPNNGRLNRGADPTPAARVVCEHEPSQCVRDYCVRAGECERDNPRLPVPQTAQRRR